MSGEKIVFEVRHAIPKRCTEPELRWQKRYLKLIFLLKGKTPKLENRLKEKLCEMKNERKAK